MHTIKNWGLSIFLLAGSTLSAQFHSLNLPTSSPEVLEEQSLGVTTISLHYHSPLTRGRKVWENPRVIPQKGEPIAWRAGANMNTTISFDTDVYIEGQALAAGTYGLHIIPDGHQHQILFAQANQLWGSYYLDQEKDVTLKVTVKDTSCAYSEKLDFEFDHQNDSTLILALEWGDRRLPMEIKVDLVKTVMHSLRSELRGSNTYRWEAWNDAAQFCYDHQQHLEEGLDWVNRSINGGYGGFGANLNLYNAATKLFILGALGQMEEQAKWFEEARNYYGDRNAKISFASSLMQNALYKEALSFLRQIEGDFPDDWVLQLDLGVALYHSGEQAAGIKQLKSIEDVVPKFFSNRLQEVIADMEAGKYQYPQAPHLS